jgi:general nucleoside transport system permease protein
LTEPAVKAPEVQEPPPPPRRPLVSRFVEELTSPSPVLVTVLAIFTALVVGAVLIVFSDEQVLSTWGYFFAAPGDALRASWDAIAAAYGALLSGAVGSPSALSETIVAATPLILAGLGIALGFRAGLFNIGAEGQLIAGGLVAGYVGFAIHGLPVFVHLPLALLCGFLGGAVWGFVPGILKAATGAHEVITTIMLNYVAINLSLYLLASSTFRRPGRIDPISRIVAVPARLPHLAGQGLRLHAGIIVALLAAVAVAWLLGRSTLGFELRASGANPAAALTAGIDIKRATVMAMVLSGSLAGLAGAVQVLGLQFSLAPGFSGGLGFDAITLALLGRANPLGVVLAALLFGALRAGGLQMQAATSTPIDIVTVIQSLIVIFVAAPALVRAIYRIKGARADTGAPLSKGWGG